MNREKYNNKETERESSTYQLSPQELQEIYKKYGRPGELAPGHPAERKRKRLDAALDAMDRKDQSTIIFNEDRGMYNE